MAVTNTDIVERMKKRFSVEFDEPAEPKEQDIGDFKRFIDYVNQNNNSELWEWVFAQEKVSKAQQQMQAVFNNYIFEIMKPQFVKYCKDSSSDVIKNYIDTAIATSKEYVSPTIQLEEEKRQLQEIIKQQAIIIEQNKNNVEVIKI